MLNYKSRREERAFFYILFIFETVLVSLCYRVWEQQPAAVNEMSRQRLVAGVPCAASTHSARIHRLLTKSHHQFGGKRMWCRCFTLGLSSGHIPARLGRNKGNACRIPLKILPVNEGHVGRNRGTTADPHHTKHSINIHHKTVFTLKTAKKKTFRLGATTCTCTTLHGT